MSAAEIKAELMGVSPVKPSSNSVSKTTLLLPGPEPMKTYQDNGAIPQPRFRVCGIIC